MKSLFANFEIFTNYLFPCGLMMLQPLFCLFVDKILPTKYFCDCPTLSQQFHTKLSPYTSIRCFLINSTLNSIVVIELSSFYSFIFSTCLIIHFSNKFVIYIHTWIQTLNTNFYVWCMYYNNTSWGFLFLCIINFNNIWTGSMQADYIDWFYIQTGCMWASSSQTGSL